MSDGFAYFTDDPYVVAAYTRAVAERAASMPWMCAELEALGAGPCITIRHGSFPGSVDRITAIQMAGDTIPDGWRLASAELVPRRGKPGDAARQWLADHQPVDVLHVMEGHGLPRTCWAPGGKVGSWRLCSPKLIEHDGTLWACYDSEPGSTDSGFDTQRCTWTRRKLSEFHVAAEAIEAARHAGAPA